MIIGSGTALAVNGGTPVRDPGLAWPRWPQPAPNAEGYLLDVLHGLGAAGPQGALWSVGSPVVYAVLLFTPPARAWFRRPDPPAGPADPADPAEPA